MALQNLKGCEEFDLEDMEVLDGKADKFKVEKDTTYRIGFPLLNGNGGVRIIAVDFFSIKLPSEKYATTFQVSGSEEVNKACIEAGCELKKGWVTAVVQYRCDKNGKYSVPLAWDVKAAKLGAKKISALKNIVSAIREEDDDVNLGDIDVSVTSPNPDFQEHSYVPLKSAIWRMDSEHKNFQKLGLNKPIYEEVLSAAKGITDKLTEVVAYKYSDAKILDLIGVRGEKSSNLDDEFESLDESDLV